MKEGLPQRIASPVGLDVGPEEIDQCLARGAPPRREGEEQQQRQRLPGSQQRGTVSVGASGEHPAAQRPQEQRWRKSVESERHITG